MRKPDCQSALPPAQTPGNRPAMDGSQAPQKAPAGILEAPKAPRMRPALRKAVLLIAEQGRTQRDAAERAGMNEKSLSRALKRPEIANYLEYAKALAVCDADQLKGQAKAIAIRVGIDLLHDAKSEAVRARMVEFFAGETRQPSVAVQINNGPSGGYVYRRPDDQSVVDDAQVIEGKAEKPEA